MSPLLLALVLFQTPEVAPLTTPPLAPPSTEAVSPGAEPPEVKLFAEFVDRHLLAIGASGSSMEVRQRERVFRLQDDDFETAFKLVPEAFASAQQAHSDFLVASRLQIAGLAVVGAALAVTVVSTLVRTLLLPLLIASLAASGVGLVLSLIALPFALSAQSKFFSAVAGYNRGLLDLRPPQNPALGGGLTLALPE
ncbi:MAG: hypothetical protein Q8N23_12895 [Archangium sp.]|nr:hypothetical protein [Archangium sp.]MDP3574510.1 hypothetical protein [Archangium sp.]